VSAVEQSGGASAVEGVPPTFPAVWDGLEDVDGWLTQGQAEWLWHAAQKVRDGGRIVEIGSFRGRSTTVLGSAAAPSTAVIAIDPHGGGDRGPQELTPDARRGEDDHQSFRANLERAGLWNRIRHVRLPSDRALDEVDGAVDLLFIDGAHRYRPARADIVDWGERVRPGGVMLIHDSFNAIGVTLAQLRVLFVSDDWRYNGRTGSLAEYRKLSSPADDRGTNLLRQLPGLAYFVRNMTIKVLIEARLGRLTRLLGGDGTWPY
jgi:hypothetical protein